MWRYLSPGPQNPGPVTMFPLSEGMVTYIQLLLLQNVIPRQYYKDEAFERLISELQTKNTDGYELMAKSEDLTIYRRPRGVRHACELSKTL